MSLSIQIMDEIKTAMRAKDTVAFRALRAIKSEIFSSKTAQVQKRKSPQTKLNYSKISKTVRESAKILQSKTVMDLAEPESQIAVIEKFLPAQLSEAEVEV
jgi:uncharacterized protein YqeY